MSAAFAFSMLGDGIMVYQRFFFAYGVAAFAGAQVVPRNSSLLMRLLTFRLFNLGLLCCRLRLPPPPPRPLHRHRGANGYLRIVCSSGAKKKSIGTSF